MDQFKERNLFVPYPKQANFITTETRSNADVIMLGKKNLTHLSVSYIMYFSRNILFKYLCFNPCILKKKKKKKNLILTFYFYI